MKQSLPHHQGSLYRSAFSLVELLAVIAVTCILAALVLVGVSGAKGRAQRIQCASNVRQLGIAMQQFVSDHHIYPLYRNNAPATYADQGRSWIATLEKAELSGRDTHNVTNLPSPVWLCPSINGKTRVDGYAVSSYGYNALGLTRLENVAFESTRSEDRDSLGLGGHTATRRTSNAALDCSPPVQETEVARPHALLAIGDGFIGGNDVVTDISPNQGRIQRTMGLKDIAGSTARARSRHHNRANMVFCDGHVESPTFKFLFEDTSDAALSHWNRDHLPHRHRL